MASYAIFVTPRASVPDPVALLAAVKTATGDATAVLTLVSGTWYGKKAGPWSPADMTATQNALDTVPALTPQRQAQNEIDAWPIAQRALVLALIDQLNVIRGKLSPALPAITPAQALQAVRDKAGTL